MFLLIGILRWSPPQMTLFNIGPCGNMRLCMNNQVSDVDKGGPPFCFNNNSAVCCNNYGL